MRTSPSVLCQQGTGAALLSSLTDRDRRLLLDLAAVGLAPPVLITGRYFTSSGRARQRLRDLELRGLLESLPVSPTASPRHPRRYIALAPAGIAVVRDLGGVQLDVAMIRYAAVHAAAVEAVAEGYFALPPSDDWAGEWLLRPILPGRHGVTAPQDAWALARHPDRRRTVVFDLDLPGRALSQVADRLAAWAQYRAAGWPGHVSYVSADPARRARITALATDTGYAAWLHTGHPAPALRALFGLPDSAAEGKA